MVLTRLPPDLPGALPDTGYGTFEDVLALVDSRPHAVPVWLLLAFILGLVSTLLTRWAVGASLGERLLNLRLITSQGSSPSIRHQATHYFVHVLGLMLCLVGYAWALVDTDGQGLGERLTGTRLVEGP